MPIYEHRCGACGTFEQRAPVQRAGEPVPCPGCGALAQRIFCVPSGRSAQRARQLSGLGAGALGRVQRSDAGEPTVGPQTAGGRRISVGAGPPGPARPQRPARPWQLGH